MLTLLIGVTAAVSVFFLTGEFCGFTQVWSMVCGFAALFLVQILTALLLRFRSKKINAELQQVMQDTQKRIEQRQQIFLRQRNTNQKMLMTVLEKEQRTGLEQALAVCEKFQTLCKWNFMMAKQITTMKMAFRYQMKDWAEVDRLMPKCVFMEPQSISMKLARMYQNNDPKIDKFYRKKFRMLRKDACVLPAAAYSWILLKLGKEAEALKVLNDALKKTSNETIRHNRDAVANKKIKQFSNAPLAELWYALGLEEPKMPRMQQKYVYR